MSDQPGHDGPSDHEPDPAPRLGGLARTLLLGAAAALAFVVGAAVTAMVADRGVEGPVTAQLPTSQLEGRTAPTQRAPLPDAELRGFVDGDPVDLASYRGQPVVVNLWATWCAPCVKEMPYFEDLWQAMGDGGRVLGVNVQDAPANAEAFVAELGITYDLAADPDGEFYAAVEAFGMPTTLFVERDGTIVYRHTGILEADQLRDLVGDHLGVELEEL